MSPANNGESTGEKPPLGALKHVKKKARPLDERAGLKNPGY
ncbi:hypothetical protein ACFL3H_07150 [Gemmatimonadota bacterium]